MFEAFFTDSCLRYRIEVINGIDFYGLGFGMVRGESMGKWISQWMQKGETASVLITNTKLPDTSGFEFAERIRSQCPRVRVIFVTDTPSFAEAQQAVRFGAYAYLLKSDGIEALQDAMIRVSEELHAESREEAYLCSQRNWDECIPKLLKLLLALKPEIDEDHWQMYSRVKPLLNNASFRMEALLARALMEELRTEIRRRDEALAAQIRSSMMAVPLDTLASAQGTAACIDAIWALLSEKGYITQEDALKSDTIGRACVYMQTHLGEKLTAESVAAYAHISSRHFVRKFRAEMNETFAEYLLRIRINWNAEERKGRQIHPGGRGLQGQKELLHRFQDLYRLLHARISAEAESEPARGAAAGIRRRRSSVDAKANQSAHAEIHVRFA